MNGNMRPGYTKLLVNLNMLGKENLFQEIEHIPRKNTYYKLNFEYAPELKSEPLFKDLCAQAEQVTFIACKYRDIDGDGRNLCAMVIVDNDEAAIAKVRDNVWTYVSSGMYHKASGYALASGKYPLHGWIKPPKEKGIVVHHVSRNAYDNRFVSLQRLSANKHSSYSGSVPSAEEEFIIDTPNKLIEMFQMMFDCEPIPV